MDAGYNVLTWDARGFGGSGGQVMVDNANFEGRDVQALLTHVANQPEAQLDRPGDPRVGMTGASYGGGIQLVTAGIDRRVDAITPVIAWNSLLTSLYKDGSPKLGWGSVLGGVGLTSLPGGVLSPAGPQVGLHRPAHQPGAGRGRRDRAVLVDQRELLPQHRPAGSADAEDPRAHA